MFPSKNPTQTKAWHELQEHLKEIKREHLRNLFLSDSDRFSKFSVSMGELLFDYSKNLITARTMELLLQLAQECQLEEAIGAIFNGEKINVTENRSVLHVALRNFSGKPMYADGVDVMPLVEKVQKQMQSFCGKIHSGEWIGYTGKKIRYIVNIGIGGSDLGPVMVTEALRPYWINGIETFFVSNVDGTHVAETLKRVRPMKRCFLSLQKHLPRRKR
jgi:glucose-6-phosphate isomerase